MVASLLLSLPEHLVVDQEAEADRFLIRKEVSFFGLTPVRRTADAFHGRGEPDRAAKQILGAMVAEGDLIEVRVEGWKQVHYALGSVPGCWPR